jgi:hypothetical protein
MDGGASVIQCQVASAPATFARASHGGVLDEEASSTRLSKYFEQVHKVRRPETRDLLQGTKSADEGTQVSRDESHPSMAENPEVSQPGLEPDMMSLRPLRP